MIIIGGTGRSGTTILAQMFQQDPRFAVFIEPRFLIDAGGAMDYAVNQTISRDHFNNALRKIFIPHMVGNLIRFDVLAEAEEIYSPQTVDKILEGAGEKAGHDRYLYVRHLTLDLLSLVHNHLGTSLIAYKTPHTVLWAAYLAKIFPTAHFVHIIRDPRDVCASVLPRNWGPSDVRGFASWYNSLMQEAYTAQTYISPDHYVTISLDRLVERPESAYLRLLEALRIGSPPPHTLHEISVLVTPENCHRARFRKDLTPDDADYVHNRTWRSYKLWFGKSIV